MMLGGWSENDPTKYVNLSYAEAQATANTTITAATDTLLDSMTITPVSGTHIIWFTTSFINSSTGADTYFSVYVNGVQVANSERRIRSYINGVVIGNQPNPTSAALQCLVTTDGTQVVEIRARRTAGTSTIYQRTMTMLKVADA